MQRYRGRPVLTWWRGETAKGIGNGRYVILDDRYHVVANVIAGQRPVRRHPRVPDHEAQHRALHRLPPVAHRPLVGRRADRRQDVRRASSRRSRSRTARCSSSGTACLTCPLDESYEPLPKDDDETWDYFHINAIEPLKNGNFLVSARHTHTIYEIRRSDGAILWRLGGKKSDFRLGRGAHFAWQHDPRLHPDGTLSLFDNGASRPAKNVHSRALVLRLDTRRRTARLVHSYAHRPELLSTSQGNTQVLPDGHVFVGWGSNDYFTEFARDGKVLLDGRFGTGKADSYRAYRFRWVGHPVDRPAVVARAGGRTAVYVSWNGATASSGGACSRARARPAPPGRTWRRAASRRASPAVARRASSGCRRSTRTAACCARRRSCAAVDFPALR